MDISIIIPSLNGKNHLSNYLSSVVNATNYSKYETEIIVIDNFENSNQTFQDELTNDLISIIHHYSMKLYSNRRQKFKEIEKMLK